MEGVQLTELSSTTIANPLLKGALLESSEESIQPVIVPISSPSENELTISSNLEERKVRPIFVRITYHYYFLLLIGKINFSR